MEEIIIDDNSPSNFSCIVQWNGKSDLAPPNEVLNKILIINPYKKEIKEKAEGRVSYKLRNKNEQLFNDFLEDFLSIIDLIEGNITMKNLICEEKFKEEDFRDFFKSNFESKSK